MLDALEVYDLVVLDAAPTGHALRLLETPAAVRAWAASLRAAACTLTVTGPWPPYSFVTGPA